MYLRLRQLCLVAAQLEPVVEHLAAVFDVAVCHRDPAVGRFGLHNALLPFGTSFIEVVAPLREGTTAGRYLERRGGDGGYMVILDSDDLPHWRTHTRALGVRAAAELAIDDYEGLQLHPRDTGGALLEINSTRGGAELLGPYGPAGAHWQGFVRTSRVHGIAAAVLQGDDPAALAQRWSAILQRPCSEGPAGHALALDNAELRFQRAGDGRGEGLAGIAVRTNDPAAIREAAVRRGCPVDAQAVHIGGIRFELVAAAAAAG